MGKDLRKRVQLVRIVVPSFLLTHREVNAYPHSYAYFSHVNALVKPVQSFEPPPPYHIIFVYHNVYVARINPSTCFVIGAGIPCYQNIDIDFSKLSISPGTL